MRKIVFVSALTLSSVVGWSADWLTDGGDNQRTHWQKEEKPISPAIASYARSGISAGSSQLYLGNSRQHGLRFRVPAR